MSVSSSARVTIPTGFVKSTIQASAAARRATSSARSSTTGTVRRALPSPPGAGGLLPEATAGQRDRLVVQPGLLTAHAQLHQHRVRPVEGALLVASWQSACPATAPCEDAGGERGDHVEPVAGWVEQDELADRPATVAVRPSPSRARGCRSTPPR